MPLLTIKEVHAASQSFIENMIRSIINEYGLIETIEDIGTSLESIESFSQFIASEPDIITRFNLPADANAIADLIISFYNNYEEEDLDIAEISEETTPDALEFQDYLNEGVDEENHWTGIYNNAVLLENGFDEYEVEEFVKELNIPAELQNDERTQDFKNYLLSAILSIDSKMNYKDLSVDLLVDAESLKQYEDEGEFRGLFVPPQNKIVVNNRSRNTINHEIGHYVDKYLSDIYGGDGYLSMSFKITSLNNDLRERMPHDLLLWADKFHRFIHSLKQKAQIRQFTNNEVFARFIEYFINWTQGISNITNYKEHDNFETEDCANFVRLLQERSYLISQERQRITNNP